MSQDGDFKGIASMQHALAWTMTCAFILLAFARTAAAERDARWDCYLRGGGVDCTELGNAYFESVPGLRRTDEGALEIEVRSTALASARRYAVSVVDPASESQVRVAANVPSSRGGDQALLEVLALLHQATMPFLRVSGPATNEDGVFRLEATSNEQQRDEPSGGWYFRPRLGGDMFRGGITVVSINGGLTLNHSAEQWRFFVDGDVAYRYVDFDLPGDASLTGGFVTAIGSAAVARSLGRGFSAALLGRARREPQNNLDLRGEVGAGLEWLQHPFLESDATNVGLRYRVLAVRDRYAAANRDDDTELWYPRHSLALFGQLHGDKVDLNLDVGIGAPLIRPEAWNVWAGADLTLRAAQGLEITLGGNVQLRRRALNEPNDFDELDPVTSVAGSNLGRLTYGARLSLSYTFGNGLLHSQDRRWR